MESNLVIDVQPDEISIALTEDGRLVELQREKQNGAYSVGDIYLGRVRKVMPGLNAAFVDIGHPKQAFLHYKDLGASFDSLNGYVNKLREAKPSAKLSIEKIRLEKEIPKDGNITEKLKAGDRVMVQITKEAISSKGPRLCCELSFAGHYLVILPFVEQVSVSQKIRSAQERERLKQTILSIKPKNVGVIVRTSAKGLSVAELYPELKALLNKWLSATNKLRKNKDKMLLHEETSRLIGLLRDSYTFSFKHIYINDPQITEETKAYVEKIYPGEGKIVELYDKKRPIFDHFGITRQIKHAFGREVTYKKGAYLIIEQTEAMHVIDVNSGNRAKNSKDQENTAVDVNMSACEEISRQLRLRDLGGIIVVDFIDMGVAENRKKLFEHMNTLMKADRATHSILPLSKFGLMQITRQRVRPSTKVSIRERCPSCGGKGEVESTLFFVDELESAIAIFMKKTKIKKLIVHLHPFVHAYVSKGFLGFGSLLSKWKTKYGKGLSLVPDQSVGIVEAQYYDMEKNDLSHFLDEDVKSQTETD